VNATQFVHQQVAEANSLMDAAMAGVTDEHFIWLPPGTIHPIKSALLHVVAGDPTGAAASMGYRRVGRQRHGSRRAGADCAA
jgi:hypothetical protein